MVRGRRPSGPRLVQGLQGSELAKHRLQVVLQTVAGERTIFEACQELGIGTSAFHALRRQTLQVALADLEPRPVGRPRREAVSAEAEQLTELEAERDRLSQELQLSQVREELALCMPAVFGAGSAARKKKARRQKKARRRRKRQ